MNVAAMLKAKGRAVVTAEPETLLIEIVRMLREHRVGSIVLVDVKGAIAGIVSERDVVRNIASHGASVLEQSVSNFMTKNVVTCGECDTLADLMAQMTAHRFRHVPVVDHGELVGIISIGDVVKMRIAEAEMETNAMREYIATG